MAARQRAATPTWQWLLNKSKHVSLSLGQLLAVLVEQKVQVVERWGLWDGQAVMDFDNVLEAGVNDYALQLDDDDDAESQAA